MADDPQGVAPEYQAIWESVRNGGPGLSDATVTAIARSAHMKTALLYGARLRASEAATAAAAERLRAFTDGIQSVPISWETGVCCCGSPVDEHGWDDGHSPVDAGAYFIQGLIEQALAALPSTPPVARPDDYEGPDAGMHDTEIEDRDDD